MGAMPAVTSHPVLAQAEARLRGGDPAAAAAILARLVDDASAPAALRAAALKLRARIREAAREPRAAVADLRSAAALLPGDARVRNELGIALADDGQHEAALQVLHEAVALDPGYARGWNNLGNALRGAGRMLEARDAFARAVQADPRYVLGWTNLAVALRDQGELEAAADALRRALAVDPRNGVALSMLAAVERERGDLDAAVALLQRMVQSGAADATAWLMLGETLAERDELDRARQAFGRALDADPGMLRAALGARLLLPMVPASASDVDHARTRFAEGIAVLERELPARAGSLASSRLHDELRWTNFLLAYQGRDDLALQCRYGDLVTGLLRGAMMEGSAAGDARAVAHERVRVGFVSAFFRDGTAGRYFEHWVTDLPRERFEVHLFVLNAAADALTRRVAARADDVQFLSRHKPSAIAERLRGAALDAIVYPELGMNATAFALAATRLAPVQCAAWGHPVTSGLPTIDAYFTSAPMEPDDGASHYRERLIPLPGLGTRYAMPAAPEDAQRAAFGLPDGVPLLLCPQSLFKIHPDNDALFVRVLAALPQARLVLFRGRHPALTAAYLERVRAAASDAGIALQDRVHVLAHASHANYLRVNRVCDLMLDTLHWSGGNTSLDAIACALPIVTQPGRFMRGRQSAAMLRLMGVPDAIARDDDEYVRIAARLGSDAAVRADLRARIVASRPVLFDDPAPVAALAEHLERLVRGDAPEHAAGARRLPGP
jgi:CRISPR-associated protein Csy1